jgi:hypothetical protein
MMRLVRLVRKKQGGLEMIQVFPSQVEAKKAEGWAVIKIRDGEDPLEVYQRGRQAVEAPAPAPELSVQPPTPAEVLAGKSDAELKIIAETYGVEHPPVGRDDLIAEILTRAGYEVQPAEIRRKRAPKKAASPKE